MSKWNQDMTQDEMMIKDECILVDNNDHIIGHCSKKTSHVFDTENNRGKLHRAFSVFLFDEKGRLLLQQRAASKITFPNVWTNTCCSHPLYGFEPNEVDDINKVVQGVADGAKNAAIRKLEHELGIKSSKFKTSEFKFLTRLHYWAADVITHGPESPWGEHEIDYILFIQKKVTCKPHPEEVSDTMYVTLPELQRLMLPESGLLWSPWFRIIAEKFLVHWWKDLKTTLKTDKFVDWKNIYRFDPTSEHMGGGGHAGPWLGSCDYPMDSTEAARKAAAISNSDSKNDPSLKQGAYGKVKIHKHSKWDQVKRLDEVFSALWLIYGPQMESNLNMKNENVQWCSAMLGKVSRSFAAVIRQLPEGLCIDVLVFYLALRALDTIEDDMTAFCGREHVKIDHLNNFYRTGLVTEGWSMSGVGEGDEQVLLQKYFICVAVFKQLSPASQEVIADITKRMGQGMAQFVSKDLGQGTVKVLDYDLYCHFVAGLVGEGLSRLFTCSGYEQPNVAAVAKTTANTMGLFLQKTNIIRDYLEDYVDGRAFWPQEIWKKYAPTGKLGDFALAENQTVALHCLNELVTNALQCIPECLQYMELLKTEEVFRFCAIPQVMAVATLGALYNNPKVFTGVVKIRKGQAAQLMLDTKTLGGLHKWFYLTCSDILARVPSTDPNAEQTRLVCEQVIRLTEARASTAMFLSYTQAGSYLATALLVISVFLLFAKRCYVNGKFSVNVVDVFVPGKPPLETAAATIFLCSFAFIFVHAVIAAGQRGLTKAADKRKQE